jgi:hypothetical protein
MIRTTTLAADVDVKGVDTADRQEPPLGRTPHT